MSNTTHGNGFPSSRSIKGPVILCYANCNLIVRCGVLGEIAWGENNRIMIGYNSEWKLVSLPSPRNPNPDGKVNGIVVKIMMYGFVVGVKRERCETDTVQ